MSILEAVLLAIIEGLTEFLPVSSTGHIIIGSSILGIAEDPFTKVFTVAIQFGAIISVIVLYWRRFIPSKENAREYLFFYLKLAVAFIPAAIAGFLFNDYIDALLERVEVVGYTLLIGGIFFLFMDRIFQKNENLPDEKVTYKKSFLIGVFQTMALVPGVSRSAATIIGGLTQNLKKRDAAEFSFFLAVPTMFFATLYKMYSFYSDGGSFGDHEVMLLIVGNVVAFAVAWLAIKSFIGYLANHGFKIFGYYRIIVGLVIIILYYLDIGLKMV